MKVSVVIPCYNAATTLAETLDAVTTQQWNKPWEVVVVDNGCTDDSTEIAARYAGRMPSFRVVDASARRGQPAALNAGVRAARGESVVFCDADDIVAPGWLTAMGDALETNPFVACRIDTQKLNSGQWVSGLHGHVQQDSLQTLWYPPYLPHAGSGTLGIRKQVHEWLGGFDERMPYVFDTDYCVRAQLRGIPLRFVPNATVHIRFRTSTHDLLRQSRLWAEYNVMLYSRHRPSDHRELWRWKRYLSQWRTLLATIPMRGKPTDRARWLWSVAWQFGLLLGSLKYLVPPV